MINLSKNQLTIIIAIGIIVISVIGYYIYSLTTNQSYEQLDTISEEIPAQETENVEKDEEEYIVVHIAGEVKKPGIVRIKEGARVADIIEQAEGLTDNANITNINLAYIIEDGQKITIPSKEENEEVCENISNQREQGKIEEMLQKESNKISNKININKATKEELQTLQGIGESTAEKIIEYKRQNGDFKKIEDIKNVPGIGDAKFEGIKENIKVK